MSLSVEESISQLTLIVSVGDSGNLWLEDLDHKSISDWIEAERTGREIDPRWVSIADDYVRSVVAHFDCARVFYEGLHRVKASDNLVAEFLYYGVNSWNDGYRWIRSLSGGMLEWSLSMFNAVDMLTGGPFRLAECGRTTAVDAVEKMRIHGASKGSVDAVVTLREFAAEKLTRYSLQNPLWFEDDVNNRLSSEVAQIRAMVSGTSCRLPTPPGDWLTSQDVPDFSTTNELRQIANLYRTIKAKGHIAPDHLVGKDQAGILRLRVLERLGLYHGYARKASDQISERVSHAITSLKLTSEMVETYVS